MKRKCIAFGLAFVLAMSLLVMPDSLFGQEARNTPGTDPTKGGAPKAKRIAAITPFSTETGFVSLSIDGLGSNAASGIIQVLKPAGATVRKAFMAAASTGFSNRVLANGDVKINGTNVVWNVVATTPSSISSHNSLADVTSIVKPVVDAAPTGRVDFTITEVSTLGIDGELLAVVFNDPNQTVSNTVVLLFGAQNIAGDSLNIGLANPINLSDPNLKLDFGLGISFSFQVPPGNINQVSLVNVNGSRLSSAAGGQDDSDLYPGANGSLMTVGGLDNTNGNPPPFGPPTQGDSIPDDELYNLIPFVTNGATSIKVNTINPSNDDNIFFASLFLGSQTAVVGEGILLAPLADTNNVGTTHTVTATVQNNAGQPIPNRSVTFRVKAGPHVGQTATSNTNASGQTTFTYTGTTAGRDTLIARMTNTAGQPDSSNPVTKLWVAAASNPPSFVSPTPTCGSTLNASVGNAFSFTVRASDPDAGNTVTLFSSALPTGATMTPALPTSGNPVQSVFNWTPTTTQTGLFTIIYTAMDNTERAVQCTLRVNVTGGPPPDNTPPSCTITSIIPGPPKQVLITIQDLQSGLASIVPVTVINATLNIPSFTVGTTSPVVVTATKINQTLSSTVLLRATDVAGNFVVCDPVYTTISGELPQEFSLGGNYPNPFNPTTKINFNVAKTEGATSVTLTIYDLLGREVKTLISEPMQAGQYFVEWDGTNDKGVAVTSGVYVYRMVAGDFIATRRMTLMK